MSKYWLITWDVYKKNTKSISFIIMILIPFILIGIVYGIQSFSNHFSEKNEIGIISTQSSITQYLPKITNKNYVFKRISKESIAEKKLKEKEIDAYLTIEMHKEKVVGKLYATQSLGSMKEAKINQYLNQIQFHLNANKLGLSNGQIASLNQKANFSKIRVSFDKDGKIQMNRDNTAVQTGLVYLISIFLIVIIITYSTIIAQEIASEKGTRIMEIILSSTRAQTHFYGKLTGIILMALTQFFIYILCFTLSYQKIKNIILIKEFISGLSINTFIGPLVIYTLFFTLIGTLSYAVLAALCGSLVSRPEDTAKAVQPVAYLGMIGYFTGIILGMTNPQNMIVRVTSYLPFFSSFTMPVRLATETATGIEAGVSCAILFLFTIFLTLFSAQLYKTNVLVYNEGGIWRSLKQSIFILSHEK